jgi:hypothetical protein
MAINESAVLTLSGMATSYRRPMQQGVKRVPTTGLIAVARLAKPCPHPRNFSDRGCLAKRPDF